MNIYEQITNRMLNLLEQNIVPWQQPWAGPTGAVSHSSGRPYSLINQILLLTKEEALDSNFTDGFPSREFITFNQIKAEGGRIKKGEKSRMVVFWKQLEVPMKDVNGDVMLDDDGNERKVRIPMLRYFNVWEVAQCEGIKRKYGVEARENEPVEAAERIAGEYFSREACIFETKNSNHAYYSPTKDLVHVPLITQFDCAEEYYSTLFHEMTHSTGHSSRLNRLTEVAAFGSEDYGKEELVAEFGSAFLVNRAGMDSEKAFNNSASYIKGWAAKLRSDSRLFVNAAAKAEAAVNYILGTNNNFNS